MKTFIEIFLFEGDVYYNAEELSEHLAELVEKRYPEIVHSDFMADESSEFESLWEEVETIELDIQKLKENM